MGEASQPLNRTKVYLLNDDGQWDDRGTGHAEIQYMPAEDAAFIIVMSEENAETSLLQTKIHMQDIYQRQQDTTRVYDDQADYFETAASTWSTEEERAEAERRIAEAEALAERREVRVTIDLAGRRVVEGGDGDGGGAFSNSTLSGAAAETFQGLREALAR